MHKRLGSTAGVDGAPPEPHVCVLDADPALGSRLSATEYARAREASLAPMRTLRIGDWHPESDPREDGGLGLLLLDGLLRHRIKLLGGISCELLGAGDLLLARRCDPVTAVPVLSEWTVRATTPVAVLNAGLIGRLAAWPSVLGELAQRTERRAHALAIRMAITRVPSLEIRVMLLFWHLADRWGHAAAGGVVLSLKPEQETIGNLIGASRGRVNTALGALKDDGSLREHPHGWLLREPRP